MVMNCILCGSPAIHETQKILTSTLVRAWEQSFNIDISKEISGTDEVLQLHCKLCDICFFSPLRPATSGVYVKLQSLDWYYMPHKWEHTQAVRDIATEEKVLEVGCGFGDFVSHLRTVKKCDVSGIELNPSAAEIAQSRGLPVVCSDLKSWGQRLGNMFDVVCSFQVLEHVTDPREFIQDLLAVLKPSGRLILGVPNRLSFLKHQFNVLDLPPHHLTQWSAVTFEFLEKIFPARLVKVAYEPLQAYHVDGCISAYGESYAQRNGLWGSIIYNRFTRVLSSFLLKQGLGRLFKGQSLYAVMVKTP
jgi:SAM-dependent methyltransferase